MCAACLVIICLCKKMKKMSQQENPRKSVYEMKDSKDSEVEDI